MQPVTTKSGAPPPPERERRLGGCPRPTVKERPFDPTRRATRHGAHDHASRVHDVHHRRVPERSAARRRRRAAAIAAPAPRLQVRQRCRDTQHPEPGTWTCSASGGTWSMSTGCTPWSGHTTIAGAAARAARWPRSRYSARATGQPDVFVDPPGDLQLDTGHPGGRWRRWGGSGTVGSLVTGVRQGARGAVTRVGAVAVPGSRPVRWHRLDWATDHRRTSVRRARSHVGEQLRGFGLARCVPRRLARGERPVTHVAMGYVFLVDRHVPGR
jgi:hypothetical protein